MSKLRYCYIHVGTHKTGTTSIQAFLAANAERFAASGVFFPQAGTEDDAGIVAHHELAKELLGHSGFNPRRGGLDAVAAELARTEADVACLTSEDFCFLHDRPRALARLRDAIRGAGFTPRIVVYLRPQASYCAAVYAENVRHGYRTPFDAYFADVLHYGRYIWRGGSGPPFDYMELLKEFATVFGRHAVIARVYRSGAPDSAILFSFAKILAGQGIDLRAFHLPSFRHNGSLSFGDVLRLLGVNHNVTVPLRFTPLDITGCARLGKRFLVSNIRLALRYRVVVPVFEPIDIALASPLRRTRSKMQALRLAREATNT